MHELASRKITLVEGEGKACGSYHSRERKLNKIAENNNKITYSRVHCGSYARGI
jgi:hypothetical protein